jgi:hypothetical protein
MRPRDGDDIQVIRDELRLLRAEVDADRSARRRPWWTRAARPTLARRLTRVGLVALVLALPMMVSASHQFSDVPTSHTFHTTISRLYGARLTTGCATGKFCPNANVTRGQMSAFLARGLGRGAGDSGWHNFDNNWAIFDSGVLATVDLQHGGTSGGSGHVLVTGNVSAYTDDPATCPCELQVHLLNADTNEESLYMYEIIGSEPSPDFDSETRYYEGSTSVSHLFSVQSGVAQTYALVAEMHTTQAQSASNNGGVEFDLSAVYIPFGANGGNPTPSPAVTQGATSPRRQ